MLPKIKGAKNRIDILLAGHFLSAGHRLYLCYLVLRTYTAQRGGYIEKSRAITMISQYLKVNRATAGRLIKRCIDQRLMDSAFEGRRLKLEAESAYKLRLKLGHYESELDPKFMDTHFNKTFKCNLLEFLEQSAKPATHFKVLLIEALKENRMHSEASNVVVFYERGASRSTKVKASVELKTRLKAERIKVLAKEANPHKDRCPMAFIVQDYGVSLGSVHRAKVQAQELGLSLYTKNYDAKVKFKTVAEVAQYVEYADDPTIHVARFEFVQGYYRLRLADSIETIFRINSKANSPIARTVRLFKKRGELINLNSSYSTQNPNNQFFSLQKTRSHSVVLRFSSEEKGSLLL